MRQTFLYNLAAKEGKIAQAIAEAVKKIDANLIFYGLSGSYLISEATKIGLKTVSEVFADRTYQNDGNLTPRSEPNSLIKTNEEAISQVLQMIHSQTVRATNGENVEITAETICLHGDGANALEFAKLISQRLSEEKINISAIQ